jgi:hypothetical protein
VDSIECPYKQPLIQTAREIQMVKKYKVTFDIYVDENETTNLEYFLQDLLQKSVLPALSAELVPLSMYVTKKRVA